MTLDYYLVRHDRRETFHLGDHRTQWGAIFPITSDKIHRFGPHLLGHFEKLFAAHAPDLDGDLPGYTDELVRRIRAWAGGAPGIYCITDSGDHMDFVHAHHYRTTSTGFARRVGSWWLDHFTFRGDGTKAGMVLAHHDDGFGFAMGFQTGDEASRIYHAITEDELADARAQDPKRARG